MIWETESKIQLLKVELKRLDVLLDMVSKGSFEWGSKICPVCCKARELIADTGFTVASSCTICNTMDISARCHSIDSAYCLRGVGDNQLTDEDIEFFENLFTKYMMNAEDELDILQ